ncbi:MAG: hypothetical protein EDM75_10530 [Chlorobiota bacterium]|nr:MAG: hypothetical protein EDM75_10530 [Chlorobiota bacterium]
MKKYITDPFARKLLYFSLILVVIDQVTKLAVKGFSIPFLGITWDGMYLGQSFPVLGSFFRFTFVENKGIAFGIELHPVVKVLVSLVSIAASGFIVYYIDKIASKNRGAAIGLALILAGAIGNMIDRVFYGAIYGYAPFFYGHVVDFFHVVFDVTIFGYYQEEEAASEENGDETAEATTSKNISEEGSGASSRARQVTIEDEPEAGNSSDGEDNNRKDL